MSRCTSSDLGIGQSEAVRVRPGRPAGRSVGLAVFARAVEMQQGNLDPAVVQPLDGLAGRTCGTARDLRTAPVP